MGHLRRRSINMSKELTRRELMRSITAGGLGRCRNHDPLVLSFGRQGQPAAVRGPQPQGPADRENAGDHRGWQGYSAPARIVDLEKDRRAGRRRRTGRNGGRFVGQAPRRRCDSGRALRLFRRAGDRRTGACHFPLYDRKQPSGYSRASAKK